MSDNVAFMVMPFGKKATGKPSESAPETVDFDQLWSRVHKPVLTELGYQAVRADCDVVTLIATGMIQQLAVADLVVADISLSNANVYYEVGVRHAAAERGCALIAADWAKPVFDLAQMRHLPYPLTDGKVGPRAAEKAQQTLRTRLEPLAGNRSPVFEAVPGYPDDVDLSQLPSFDEVVEVLSRFDAAVEAIRASSNPERADLTRQLLASYGDKRVIKESVVLGLLRLVRDNLNWRDLMAYIERLPPRLRQHPLVREQLYLAQGKRGDPASAVGALTELIKRQGATSERQGLLGGRYKQLMNQSQNDSDRARYLDLAIEAYEKGMALDLNDYYPTSNLPRLYRLRGHKGDEHKAVVSATITAAASQRSIMLGQDDVWVRQTLLGAAFDAGDVAEASRLLLEIRTEGPARWQLESTLGDLGVSLSLQRDPVVKAELSDVLTSLQRLTDGGKP
jgi:tetratricopeptide repeat protein